MYLLHTARRRTEKEMSGNSLFYYRHTQHEENHFIAVTHSIRKIST
jgi:hypothetical protein